VLTGADPTGALLTGADLSGAVLVGATVQGAVGMEQARCDDTTVLPPSWTCRDGHPELDGGAGEAR
jgi:hypothetical protein